MAQDMDATAVTPLDMTAASKLIYTNLIPLPLVLGGGAHTHEAATRHCYHRQGVVHAYPLHSPFPHPRHRPLYHQLVVRDMLGRQPTVRQLTRL